MATVLVPLAQGCEELEAVTIIDLLRRAGITVITAGLNTGPIKASRGVTLIADTTLEEALDHSFDMIVLPGGAEGADRLNGDARVRALLKTMHEEDRYTAAICAAPRVLANVGILSGRSATGYPGTIDKMDVPGMRYTGEAVVSDGKVITSRGPGTAMDFALTLIERLAGGGKRAEVEAALVR